MPSTRELLHKALEGITHSDSRLWRTLSLLWFKPGKLTQEFVAGRHWPGTLFKAVALFVVYMVVLGVTLAGVFVYAVLQL